MNKEVEIRVIIKDPFQVEKKLSRIGKFLKSRKQIDKYFVPPQNDFFAQKPTLEYLRVRHERDKSSLNYSFCHTNKEGHLLSTDEYETLVEKADVAEDILLKMGMVPKVTVIKTRKYFEIDEFKVTLDHIAELGYFLEIEAKKDFGGAEKTLEACFKLLNKLDIEYKKSPQMGYPDMILKMGKKSKKFAPCNYLINVNALGGHL